MILFNDERSLKLKTTPQQLKSGLKILIKKKGLTYGELAGKLGVSLPTFKRWMGAEEIKLGRLLEICAELGSTLSELEAISGAEAKRAVGFFTLEQERFFCENMHYFTYLSNLYAGGSPEKIAREFSLTERSTELYLLRLERRGLLQRDGKGRVRLLYEDLPNWNPGGPLIRAHHKNIIEHASGFFSRRISKILGQEKDREKMFLTYGVHRVRKGVFEEWQKKFADLFREIEVQSRLESQLPTGPDQVYFVVSHLHTALGDKDPELRGLMEGFAPLVNL